MEHLKVHEKKSSGSWWVTKAKEEPEVVPPRSPMKQRSMSNLIPSRPNTTKKEKPPPIPTRSNTTMTMSGFVPSMPSRTVSTKRLPPAPSRSNSAKSTISVKSPATKANDENSNDTSKYSTKMMITLPLTMTLSTVTTTTEIPAWLMNAIGALDLLTTDHPKVMTTLSAVLITVGSIPAIPAIAGGAGGALLASGAAHAAGAVAVGVGSWIKQQQDTKQKNLAIANGSEASSSKKSA